MNEQATGPEGSSEPGDTNALAAFSHACESFLDAADSVSLSLQDAINASLEAHGTAFTQLEEVTPANEEQLLKATVDYSIAVSERVVVPLREALRGGDVPSLITQVWDEASQPIHQQLAGLRESERQEISPQGAFLGKLARAVAEFEVGVVDWTRSTLAVADSDGRSVSNSSSDGGGGQVSADDTEARDNLTWRFEELSAAGKAFEERLKRAADSLEALRADVAAEVDAAATKHLKRLEKALSAAPAADAEAAPPQTAAVNWTDWYRQVDARLELSVVKWALLRAVLRLRTDFLESIHEDVIDELHAAGQAVTEELIRNRELVEEIFVRLGDTGKIKVAARELNAVLGTTKGLIETELVSRLARMQAAEAEGARANRVLDELRSFVNELPESLVVHSVRDGDDVSIDRNAAGRELLVRSAAVGALDNILAPTTASWSEELVENLKAAAGETDNLQPVLRFYIGGAVEELMDVSGKRVEAELRESAEAAASELSLSAIDRAIETLSSSLQKPAQAAEPVASRLRKVTSDYWQNVGSQVSAETAQAKLALQLEASADSAIKAVRLGTIDAAREVSIRLLRQASSFLKQGKEWLRRSQAAITGETDSGDYETTLNALAEVNKARSRLPPVYRRLFSFHPLTDESLMVGREEDTTWLRTHFVARRRGRTNAVVLTGMPGCGVTTFIDAARRTYLRRTNFCVVDLAARITEEAVLVEKLKRSLGLGDAADGNQTLASVADQIMSTEYSGPTRVCVVDRLEHLFLRKIGGFGLAAQMLRFMSETGPRIFWIATASNSAWQLLLKNEPLVQGLVAHYSLSGYDRDDIEEVINLRHRRSALPITFDPPADITTLERRRIRKAQTEEQKQAIYREAYFDDFFAASGQNVMLAIFYWLLSVRYLPDEPAIRVMPLPVLKFELLARLPVPEMFALKAFLEHATLTLDEYIEISSMDDQTAFEVFESLGNAMIIELARDEESGLMDLEFERIERSGRYRLRPLLVQPVIRSLRERNIVH